MQQSITNSFARLSIGTALLLSSNYAIAQNIHYTQFDATPLSVNPAYTGLFDGNLRASAIYHNEWTSASVPFTTFGISADKKLLANHHGDFLAAGGHSLKTF